MTKRSNDKKVFVNVNVLVTNSSVPILARNLVASGVFTQSVNSQDENESRKRTSENQGNGGNDGYASDDSLYDAYISQQSALHGRPPRSINRGARAGDSVERRDGELGNKRLRR